MEVCPYCIGLLPLPTDLTFCRYGDTWNVASSSVPDASGKLPNGKTFAQLFWDIWKTLGYKFPDDKSMCYMFEMLTPR
jgi:hypothetical protein